MKIIKKNIKIRKIVCNFKDNQEEGVYGYGGKLNIRPKYQREFIYKEKEKIEVINTIRQGFPLNTMYWVRNENSYELLDGQQRTMSFCKYIDNAFSVNGKYFDNLKLDEQDQILNYEVDVYICAGTESEKLAWFKIINIAGKELTSQELRNAIYAGKWTTDAKKRFSKTNCAAQSVASRYLKGSPIRQDYLERVLKWISHQQKTTIENYMAKHQHSDNADTLWLYFHKVITWVATKFKKYRKIMEGLDWGIFYNKYHHQDLDSEKIEKKISKLLQWSGRNGEIQNQKGIYEYILSGNSKFLNLRTFDDEDKKLKYEQQKGFCVICQQEFKFDEMQADHITPWSKGGKTMIENCQLLCRLCNQNKSNK